MAKTPFQWASKKTIFRSRSKARADNNLGIIQQNVDTGSKIWREKDLEKYDAYYENRQYDHLKPWEESEDANGQFIPHRQRKPRIHVPLVKTFAERLVAKLLGGSTFPIFKIEESPDDQLFVKTVINESQLRWRLLEPVRRMLSTGSSFVRFYLVEGVMKFEWFHAKHCYPTFAPNGDLQEMEIRYVFVDSEDRDQNGNPKKKWFKLLLTQEKEVMFDNPEFKPNEEMPEFTVVDEVEHNFGFVQGEWLANGEQRDSIDGVAMCKDVMDFADELCYSLSQSSMAVGYNQDPQLTFTGLSEDEIDEVVRSSTKSWNLGKEGEAKLLESSLTGVQTALELRDKIRLAAMDTARVLLMDPEKMVTAAQSAKSLEVLHGPMIDLIDELRPMIEPKLKAIVLKMSIIILASSKRGLDVPIEIPPGYVPKSLDIIIKWRPVFQQTIEDLQKKVSAASSAVMGRMISEETATKFVAEDFGVEDIDAERALIDARPPVNPFGGF